MSTGVNIDDEVSRLSEKLRIINRANYTSSNVDHTQRQVHFDDNFGTWQEAVNSTSHGLLTPHCSSKYVDVSRWKLRFDGTSSVTDFLEQLEEMRVSRNLTRSRLFSSISELLEGDAAVWFRFAREKISNYDDFREVFRATFLPKNYEERIREILKHRTQASTESVVIYVAHMENLFSKLRSKPEEERRVSLIKSKMLPYLQMALAGKHISTLDSLIAVGREIEEASVSAQEYQSPPINPKSSVEPGLEYRRSNSRILELESPVSDNLIDLSRPPIPSASVQPVPSPVTCWNCGKPGHVRYRCTESPRRFCFRCGQQGVTVRTCSSCAGNGQGSH